MAREGNKWEKAQYLKRTIPILLIEDRDGECGNDERQKCGDSGDGGQEAPGFLLSAGDKVEGWECQDNGQIQILLDRWRGRNSGGRLPCCRAMG